MKVRIRTPMDNSPEREYALRTVFEDFLGIEIEIRQANLPDYEVTLPNGNRLIVRDHFFAKFPDDLSYQTADAMPDAVRLVENGHAPEDDLPVLYGTEEFSESGEEITCGIDIFACAFFFLTRWEEAVSRVRDAHERFPTEANFGHGQGLLRRAVVNEYVEFLWSMLNRLGYSGARRTREFELTVTHDVDRLYAKSLFHSAKELLQTKRLKRFLIGAYYKFLRVDLVGTFDRIMQLSEDRGIQSRFYFISGGDTDKEGYYDVGDTLVRGLIERVANRGHAVGFHPSYMTYADPDAWRAEKNRLDSIVGTPTTEGRQHYLRFSNPETWQIWEENGMRQDSTMGFADTVGFRCGTGDTYRLFNIRTRERLRLKQRPLLVMDSALMKQTDSVQRTELLKSVRQVSEKYKMPFTILFHNHTLDKTLWNNLTGIYEDLVRS